MKVLLVEDDAASARAFELAAGTISSPPVDVQHVTSIDQAQGRLLTEPFDVVVSDLHLPGSDPIETLNAMTEAVSLSVESAGAFFSLPLLVAWSSDDQMVQQLQALNWIAEPKGTVQETITLIHRLAVDRSADVLECCA